MEQDYYCVLGLTYDASAEEVRKAYHELALRYHPDVTHQSETSERFLKIQEAYETLCDHRRKSAYDASLDPSYRAQPAVRISARTSRDVIARVNEPQILYLLVDVICTAEPNPASVPPAHICLVVDRSTSMNGMRIDMIKSNIAQALRILKPRDVISVVSFSDKAETIIPPTMVGSLLRNETRVYDIQTSGATEIFRGLDEGMQQMLADGEQDAIRHLILLTDGHTYGDEQACLELADRARQAGIAISALGLGHEWNDQFLDQLTARSGGNTSFVTSAHDLSRYLKEIIQAASSTYARSLALKFVLDERVRLQYAFRLKPEITPLPEGAPLALGNLQYSSTTSLLFEFLIDRLPETVESLDVLSGFVHLDVCDPSPHPARLPVHFRYPVSATAGHQDVPPAIMDALSRLTLYRLQEKARVSFEEGDVPAAGRRLQYLATHLLSRGEHELAHTVLTEVEHLAHTHSFSKDGDKQIKYGTRALMLPAGPEM